jgi:hypothetical protein
MDEISGTHNASRNSTSHRRAALDVDHCRDSAARARAGSDHSKAC